MLVTLITLSVQSAPSKPIVTFITLIPTPPEAIHCSDSPQIPISMQRSYQFSLNLLRLVGLDPQHYSGHSFRIGGATSATIAGLNDYEIKLLGRWSSDCYKRYICSPLSLFVNVALQIARTKDIPYQYASPYHSST